MTVHELSRRDARRIAVRAQMLDSPRPNSLLDVVRGLSMIQFDVTNAVAPSADLVLWSRLGGRYRPADLVTALDRREVVDLRGMVRPAEDLALYRADMAEWDTHGVQGWRKSNRDWVRSNDACRRDILVALETSGPLPATELPDTCVVPWKSSGWNNNRNVGQLLELMVLRGEVALAGRSNGQRLWDLASEVYPETPVYPTEEAAQLRNERRLGALGIARARGPECSVEPIDVGPVGEPAVVEGVRGEWRVDPAQLGQPFAGRIALLSPLDRLVYDRKRADELFEFDYQLEMYKPASGRRWGYWALPVLFGDRLVGKLDITADRKNGVLRLDAVHRDIDFTAAMDAKLQREIRNLATWLELELSDRT